MQFEAIACPSCGAPLRFDTAATVAACIYCDMPVRVVRNESGGAALQPDEALDAERVSKIKELLLASRKADAMALYCSAKPNATEAEATRAISDYERTIVYRTISRKSLISRRGMVFNFGSFALTVGAVALAIMRPNLVVLGVIVAILAGLFFLAGFPILLRSLRYLSAERGEATLLHHAQVGSQGSINIYNLHLRVTPKQGEVFEAELPLPLRAPTFEKIRSKGRFVVKFFPSQPDTVVFNGHV
jgi:uncharacterized Zn finger protein (UPF0148 family)